MTNTQSHQQQDIGTLLQFRTKQRGPVGSVGRRGQKRERS
jgi:hypothetical protein